jgi:hypothetical protein
MSSMVRTAIPVLNDDDDDDDDDDGGGGVAGNTGFSRRYFPMQFHEIQVRRPSLLVFAAGRSNCILPDRRKSWWRISEEVPTWR